VPGRVRQRRAAAHVSAAVASAVARLAECVRPQWTGDGRRRCVSLRASASPARYLRHRDGEVFVDPRTGDALFHADATWCVHVVAGGIRLETAAFADVFLRHQDYRLRIASSGGPFLEDSTWVWLSA